MARETAGKLGYLGTVGVACAVRGLDEHARCTARVRQESATVDGETEIVTLAWACNLTGCWAAP